MIPLPPLTGEVVAFVVCAPIMVLLAIGIVVARKPVHSALCMAGVMVGLAVLYAAQDAPFLFVVQIIVYTGAILMLFLFVVMLIGVDSRDSVVETLRGQRVAGILAVLGLAGLLVFAVGQAVFAGGPVGLTTLAVSVGEEPETVETVAEPYLVREGLVVRTPRGRAATPAAYSHLGLEPPAEGSLFS